MGFIDSLTTVDVISLIILFFILLVLITNRKELGSMVVGLDPDGRRNLRSTLTGGVAMDPEISQMVQGPTSTNDALLLSYAPNSDYVGPDQASLAQAMLDADTNYTEIGGYIPADQPTFLTTAPLPTRMGSTDPAAIPVLMFLDPEARLAEEALEEVEGHPLLPALRLLIILLALLPLLYRVIVG